VICHYLIKDLGFRYQHCNYTYENILCLASDVRRNPTTVVFIGYGDIVDLKRKMEKLMN
jgi:hypothetical protein